MLANGILFGPIWGTLLSLAGGGGAAAAGYWIGLQGESTGKRWLGDEALVRATEFFRKHGMVAVIVSRPIPILAEAVSVLAGISRMPAAKFTAATLLGLLPTAAVYAIAGGYTAAVDRGLYAFVAVLLLAGAVWFAGKLMTRSNSPSRPTN